MSSYINLRGHKYGRLAPLYRLDTGKWKCLCDCGNITEVSVANLRRKTGSTLSCGCYRKQVSKQNGFKNLSGMRFGRLVALQRLPHKNNNDKYIWKCLCDCGKYAYPTTGSLLNGNTQSCGCYARDRASEANITHGLTGTREYEHILNRRRRARAHKVVNIWSSEMEYVLRNAYATCAMCGITNEASLEKYGENLHIDHIFPLSLGYGLSYDNACLLCRSCNSFKGNKLLDELPITHTISIIKQAVDFQIRWESR